MSPGHLPVGVIVKTWNTGDVTRACLDRIATANELPAELAIVDLGDDETTRVHAERLSHERAIALRWLGVGRRLAPGEANRLALGSLSSPNGCLLDSDVLVPRNWLGSLARLVEAPDVGLAAPLRPDPFLQWPGEEQSTEARLDAIAGRTPLAEILAAFADGHSPEDVGRWIAAENGLEPVATIEFPSSVSSCCLAFKRKAIEAAGGIADRAFDGQYGSEDVDLTWRVLDAGYAVVRTADVFVLHLRHTSLRANRVDFNEELVRANRTLYQLWRSRLLAWGRERLRRGDSLADLRQRYIIRELMRNTDFSRELEIGRRRLPRR
jgi:GT2 family glycosyltransferase